MIHLGIDTDRFSPKPVEKEKRLTVVFIGKIVQNKGVEELIKAIVALAENFPSLQLLIYGRVDPAFQNFLIELAKKSEKPDLIKFEGFIASEDIPKTLSKAHVLAAPSHYEGGPGFVYLEAMSCGLPVVGCTGSGIDEIIVSVENGILVPPKNTEAITEALKNLLENETYREMLGANARSYALNQADSRNCLKKSEEFYLSAYQKWSDHFNSALHES